MFYIIYIPENSKSSGFKHYGTKGHSGVHPYGSGKYPYQDLRRLGVMDWSLLENRKRAGEMVVEIANKRLSPERREQLKSAIKRSNDVPSVFITNMESYRHKAARQHLYNEAKNAVDNKLKVIPKESLSDLRKISNNDNLDEVRREINHTGAGASERLGRDYNCPNCATAFELVERGYRVCAKPKYIGSNGTIDQIQSYFKGGEFKPTGVLPKAFDQRMNKCTTFDEKKQALMDMQTRAETDTIKRIKSFGSGARGIIVMGWSDYILGVTNDLNSKSATSMHAFSWKNEDGKAVFYDAQGWKSSVTPSDGSDSFSDCDPRDVYLMRTDNLQLTDKVTNAVYSSPFTESPYANVSKGYRQFLDTYE